jgi:hypothetical protein
MGPNVGLGIRPGVWQRTRFWTLRSTDVQPWNKQVPAGFFTNTFGPKTSIQRFRMCLCKRLAMTIATNLSDHGPQPNSGCAALEQTGSSTIFLRAHSAQPQTTQHDEANTEPNGGPRSARSADWTVGAKSGPLKPVPQTGSHSRCSNGPRGIEGRNLTPPLLS